MSTPIEPACERRGCLRYYGVRNEGGEHVFYCEAFPNGIPLEIVTGENDHTEPVEGDDGLIYLPPPGGDPTRRDRPSSQR